MVSNDVLNPSMFEFAYPFKISLDPHVGQTNQENSHKDTEFQKGKSAPTFLHPPSKNYRDNVKAWIKIIPSLSNRGFGTLIRRIFDGVGGVRTKKLRKY